MAHMSANYDGICFTEQDYVALSALFGKKITIPSKIEIKIAHMDEAYCTAIGRYGDDLELATRAILKQQKNLGGTKLRIMNESPDALDDILVFT